MDERLRYALLGFGAGVLTSTGAVCLGAYVALT
jgi:hypothetical protein